MRRRKNSGQRLTALELEIMKVLWELGSANVQSVQARLAGRALAYTTVQTMLNVLWHKGRVTRRLKNRSYLYRPVLSRQRAITNAVREVLHHFFGGAAEGLVLNLVESRQLTPAKLARIQKMMKRHKEEGHGNS